MAGQVRLIRSRMKIDINAKLAVENPEAFFADLFDTFEKRKEAIEYLYDNENWQLFIGTITETDRLHHFFYDSAYDGKYFPVFERFYKDLDNFIGKMSQKASNNGALFLTCSDHGFTTIKTEIYLNRWLIENGYLKLDNLNGLKGMNSETRAFCLDPSRIYIHLEERYKKGKINQTNYNVLVEELKDKLVEITFEGRRVIREVFLKDEIFHGNYMDNGPDVYLLPNYGFDLKGAVNKEIIFSTSHFKGMHTHDDAHLYISISSDYSNLKIEDIPNIIKKHIITQK